MALRHLRKRRIVTAVVSSAAALLLAPAGHAGLRDVLTPCEDQSLSQPFLPWLDPMRYELAPNGGFEDGAADWQLRGGAKIVAGSEPWDVSGDGRRSLYLPTGSSATSSPVCVGTLSPTLRFFAKNRGLVALSSLRIDAVVADARGRQRGLPIGVVTGFGTWQPTLPSLVLLNLLAPLAEDGELSVAFRFSPIGLGAKWQIDDVYVDPFKLGK